MIVSFVIPIYNGEKYIKTCINSILALKRNDYEIVVIDDGSSDNTHLIMQEYENNYTSVHYIYQENAGVSVARMRGIEKAIGEYIFFVDSDDILESGSVSIVMDELIVSRYDIVLGNYIDIDHDGNHIKEYSLYNLIKDKRKGLDKIYVGDFLLNVCWGKFLRKDIIVKNAIQFDKEMKYGEDTIFMGDYLMKAQSFLCVDNNFYFYRQTPNNSVNTLRSILTERYLDETEKLIRKKREYIEYMNCDNEIKRSFIDYYGRHLSATVNLVLKQKGTLHNHIYTIGKYLKRDQMDYIINQITLEYGFRRYLLCQIYKIAIFRNLYIVVKHMINRKNRS